MTQYLFFGFAVSTVKYDGEGKIAYGVVELSDENRNRIDQLRATMEYTAEKYKNSTKEEYEKAYTSAYVAWRREFGVIPVSVIEEDACADNDLIDYFANGRGWWVDKCLPIDQGKFEEISAVFDEYIPFIQFVDNNGQRLNKPRLYFAKERTRGHRSYYIDLDS